MSPLQMFTYLVGVVVMAAGGLVLMVVVLYWAIEKAARCYTNAAAIVRIMRYARKNGLDLATGKPIQHEDLYE